MYLPRVSGSNFQSIPYSTPSIPLVRFCSLASTGYNCVLLINPTTIYVVFRATRKCWIKARLAEDKIGTMLTCNVIVQGTGDDKVEVAAVDPMASMMAIENETLAGIAAEVQGKLKNVIKGL
jgi:hypothetical protein